LNTSPISFSFIDQTVDLNSEHNPGKFDAHRAGGAVLPARATMPALQGVPDIDTIIFHINDIQGTMLVADAAKITLIRINNWWHKLILPDCA
jgi:hypothetical protein